MRWSRNCDGARKWRESLRLVAEAVGRPGFDQFRLWATKKFGPKWAYHLRGTIIDLGKLLAGGLSGKRFRFIVRSVSDVARLPEHLRADVARLLAVLG